MFQDKSPEIERTGEDLGDVGGKAEKFLILCFL